MGEGLKQPLLLAFSWKADSANPQPKERDALRGTPCGVPDSPGFSETLLLEMNRVIWKIPALSLTEIPRSQYFQERTVPQFSPN